MSVCSTIKIAVIRALGIVGLGLALALVGPSGSVNAGTTRTSTLTIDVKWPGEVVVTRPGHRDVVCKWNPRPCVYNIKLQDSTTLSAQLPPKRSGEFQFTGWQAPDVVCEGRTELQSRCKFWMPRGSVRAKASFGPKLDPSDDPWPTGG